MSVGDFKFSSDNFKKPAVPHEWRENDLPSEELDLCLKSLNDKYFKKSGYRLVKSFNPLWGYSLSVRPVYDYRYKYDKDFVVTYEYAPVADCVSVLQSDQCKKYLRSVSKDVKRIEKIKKKK